jgi:hypothetical protein
MSIVWIEDGTCVDTKDLARGIRDDLQAKARSFGTLAAHFQAEASLSLGETHEENAIEYRRLRDISDAYMTAANHIAAAFNIRECRDDDPPDSKPVRFLDEEGNPCRTYTGKLGPR